MTNTVTLNGNTYNDGSVPPNNMGNGGHRTNLFPMLSDAVVDLATKQAAAAGSVTSAAAQVTLATAQATAAAASAATAVAAPGTNATSTTTLTIATGSQSLTIQTGKSIVPGMQVVIANTSSPTNWMAGSVTSYNSGTGALVVSVKNIQGSGAGVSTWTISLSGTPGVTGVLSELLSAPIASAATINLTANATGNLVHITGNTGPITTITIPSGSEYTLIFDSNPTLTASASLLIPGVASGTNFSAQAGDRVIVRGDTAGANIVNWERASGWSLMGAPVTRSARTANTILAAADFGTFVDITSGTFSQTFTAQATLGAGWWVLLRNSGSGNITLSPAGALIDGLSSYVMYPQECRLVTCDGTNFNSIILHPYFATFTASGTFTKPPGYSQHGGIAWSGGSSGAKTNSGAANGGGGGGAFPFVIPDALISASVSITVGAGGLGSSSAGAGGNVGGSTSVGSLLTVYPGNTYLTGGAVGVSAVLQAATTPVGFEPATASATPSQAVYAGGSPSNTAAGPNGSSVYGGAAGGSVNSGGTIIAPGTSLFGGAGGAATTSGTANAGTAPGGGGGGTNGSTSGAGARGEVRLWGIV